MNHFVGRLLGKRDESRKGAATDRGAVPMEPDSIDLAKFDAYSARPGSEAESPQADEPAEPSGRVAADRSEVAADADGDAHAISDTSDFAQVGEHVAAVLSSARQAAAELLAVARADADRIRAEAEEKAEETISAATREADGIRNEAARIRSEAEAYGEETRTSAQAEIDASRRLADDERAKILANAEETAREIRAEAKRRARRIGTDAAERHEALLRDLGHAEERVQGLLTVFRGMTGELETLVKPEADTETAANVEAPPDVSIDDALRPERATLARPTSNVGAGGMGNSRNSR